MSSKSRETVVQLTNDKAITLINGFNGEIEKLLNGQIIPTAINYLCLKFYLLTIKARSTIMTEKEKDLFAKSIERNKIEIGYKWKLLYRGYKHGFDKQSLDEQCDNIQNIICIIETTKGNVFGGFTKYGWSVDNNTYTHHPFLFILRSSYDKKMKPEIFQMLRDGVQEDMDNELDNLFSFGVDGLELTIKNHCHLVENSVSFCHQSTTFRSTKETGLNGKDPGFKVKNLEIYECIDDSNQCIISYMNGHDIIITDTNNDELYINVLDMGMKDLLQTKYIYKDTMFNHVLSEWSKKMNIPLNDMLIWNFTERNNKTMRPNREIKVDLNEVDDGKLNDGYNDEQIRRHFIKTKEEKKTIKSIYDRIGNILQKKRSFLILDKREIEILQHPKALNVNNHKTILIALKYFDIWTQTLYFVDWLFVTVTSDDSYNIIIGDIVNYIKRRSYFKTLNEWIEKMNIHSNDEQILLFYEEVCVLTKQYVEKPKCIINNLMYDECMNENYYNGDIFIFQLNPFHSYFKNPFSFHPFDYSLPPYVKSHKFQFESNNRREWHPYSKNYIIEKCTSLVVK